MRSTRTATPLFRPVLLGMALLALLPVHAQIGINSTGATPSTNAMLDLNQVGRAFLAPRMTHAQRSALATAEGLMVFQNNSTPTAPKGYWYYDTDLLPAPGWVFVSSVAAWQLGGNTGTNAATDFVGTTDNMDLAFRTNGVERMGITADCVFIFVSMGHHRRKGFFLAVEALAKLWRRHSQIRCLVVGGTPSTLESLQQRLNQEHPGWREWMHFTGMVTDTERHFAAADGFLYPSWSERWHSSKSKLPSVGCPSSSRRIMVLKW